jgi:hypothetical protein
VQKQVKDEILSFYQTYKNGIDDLANYLQVPPIWLVCIFFQESGLNPKIVNGIGASGLNQLLASTAKGLGIDIVRYRTGDVAYQLESMKKFFKPVAGKIKSAGDLYLYNFYPAAIIKNYGNDEVIGEKGNYDKAPNSNLTKHYIYSKNVGLDYNADRKLTRGDVVSLFTDKFNELLAEPKEKQIERIAKVDVVTPPHQYRYGYYIAIAGATLLITYFVYKKIKNV